MLELKNLKGISVLKQAGWQDPRDTDPEPRDPDLGLPQSVPAMARLVWVPWTWSATLSKEAGGWFQSHLLL